MKVEVRIDIESVGEQPIEEFMSELIKKIAARNQALIKAEKYEANKEIVASLGIDCEATKAAIDAEVAKAQAECDRMTKNMFRHGDMQVINVWRHNEVRPEVETMPDRNVE